MAPASPRVHIGSAGSDTQSDLGTLNLAGVPTVLIERGTMRHAADARAKTDQLPARSGQNALTYSNGSRQEVHTHSAVHAVGPN